MNFPKDSLQARILLGFGMMVLVVTLVSGWTIANVSQMREILGDTLTRDMRSIELSSSMRLAVHRHHRAAVLYLLGERDSSRTIAVLAQEQFQQSLELSATLVSDSTAHAMLDRIRDGYRRYLLTFSALDEVGEAEGRLVPAEELRTFYLKRIIPEVDALNADLIALREYFSHKVDSSITRVSGEARFTIYSTAAIALLILGISVVASWRASESILRPIRRLGVSVQEIAGGNYSQTIEPGDAYAELAELVGHFNTMTRRLAEQESLNRRMLATAQLRAEKIVRDLPDLTIVTDGDGTVIYFNRQAEILLGLPARRVIGSRLEDFAGEHGIIAMMSADLAAGKVDLEPSIQTLTVAGSDRSFNYGIQTVRSEEGEIVGYLFRLQDVTTFRKVDELRTKMISTVSHELRTPLTSMGMSLELLLEDGMAENLDQVQKELLGNLHEDVGRLGAFVNDLLDLSRIDTGQARFTFRACSPRALADEVARRFDPIAVKQEIQIDTTGVGHELPMVLADSERIAQVFSNLLTNAIRYTPYRGTISVGAVADGEEVRFWVRDNGPGIPGDEVERIFDRFYQIRDDQRAGGSGLGLSIVKEIVEAHRGRVWVQSAAGFGSSFYFTLPLAGRSEPSVRSEALG
jgi:NtrC-family two-component system sensor histidine kinase KinB